MKIRFAVGLGIAASFAVSQTLEAQTQKGFALVEGIGPIGAAGGGGFSNSFGTGFDLSIGTWYDFGTSWRPWADFEYQDFNFDVGRLESNLGLPRGSFSQTSGTAFQFKSASLGVDYVPWRGSRVEPFVRGGLGVVVRSGGAGFFVSRVCPRRDPVEQIVCDQTQEEIGRGFTAAGVQFGVGTTVRVFNSLSGFVDVRVNRALTDGAPTFFPIRTGIVVRRKQRRVQEEEDTRPPLEHPNRSGVGSFVGLSGGWQFNSPGNGLVRKRPGGFIRFGWSVNENLRLGPELFVLTDGDEMDNTLVGSAQWFPVRAIPVYLKAGVGGALLLDGVSSEPLEGRAAFGAVWGTGFEIPFRRFGVTLGVDWVFQDRESVEVASGERITTAVSLGLAVYPQR